MTDDDTLQEYVEQQRVIDDILTSHAGRPVPLVIDALRAAFRDRGLPCPPPDWLRAVAADISVGHVYVVSASAVPFISRPAGENADQTQPEVP